MKFYAKQSAGVSLVEAIIVSALIFVVFGGLFAGTRYTLELIAQSRAKLSALSIANDRMELFRSLPYDAVGTIAGIPPGTIPQVSTSTLNDIEFTERVLVEYVDDPADGQLTATTTDNNGIPSDYKRVKIEVSWNIYDTPGQIALVSNIVPRSIETTVGGGTVRVNVVDEDSLPLENASVRLMNDTTTSTIDVTRFTDASGVALFSGAPAASGYEIIVTAPGFSTDQTYVATTSNPNPVTSPFSVLEADISTLTFQIDELSDITTRILTAASFASEDLLFTASTSVATSSDVVIDSNELVLAGGSGSYVSSGEAYLPAVTPTTLDSWEAATVAVATPTNTDFSVRFFTVSGATYSLIPDSDLPGNSGGFSQAIIDLSMLETGAYSSIVPYIELTSSDPSVTPAVEEFRTIYRESETAGTGVAIDFRGDKIIGTQTDGTPVYKLTTTEFTDSQGEIELVDVEFDTYTITTPSAYDIAYACPSLPLQHRAGEDSSVEILLAPNSAHSLQVEVRDDSGTLVPGAEIVLERSSTAFSATTETTPCGAAFFPGLVASDDYSITVRKTGYSDVVIDPVDVENDTSAIVIIN